MTLHNRSTHKIPKSPYLHFYDFSTIFKSTREDVRATGTYLVFLPSSNDVIYFLSKNNTYLSFPISINILPNPSSNNAIYFSSKNNTRLSFPSINNDVNYYSSKRKNDVNYGLMYVQRKICVY